MLIISLCVKETITDVADFASRLNPARGALALKAGLSTHKVQDQGDGSTKILLKILSK